MAKHHPPKIAPLVAAVTAPFTGSPVVSTDPTPPPADDFTATWRAYTQALGVMAPGQLNRANHAIRGIGMVRR
jgi:hypothetical protein